MKVSITYDKEEREVVFLVQRKLDDGSSVVSLMDAADLCEYINFQDCCSEEYKIWDVTTHGRIYECHYAGWQPNCLVEIIRDFDNKLVCSMVCEDH